MRFVALFVLLVACRSTDGGGSRKVVVTTMGGDQVEVGTTVIGHAADGTIIDETTADAVGRAEVGVDDGAFVSVLFPPFLDASTSVISVVTVPAPDAEITVHGPSRDSPPPLVVGVLRVTGRRLNAADYFDVQLGCTTVRVMALPASIDVGACNMGSDTELDVLVTAYDNATTPATRLGYGAARVPMVDGVAMIDINPWRTTGTNVPVTSAGVMPAVAMTVYSDGLAFGTQMLTDRATLWTGLVVDATRITATLTEPDGARVTTRYVEGAPMAIALADTDFLPAVAKSAAIVPGDPLSITWDANPLGDAVNLHASWQVEGDIGPHAVVWDAVLPADATSATLPAFAGDLAAAIAPDAAPHDVLVRYIDSEAHDSFTALATGGIHVEETGQPSTIAAPPTSGAVRASHAIGLR